MTKEHHYKIKIEWQGNLGEGTKDYKSYKRDYKISAENKKDISCSSDPAFRGDPTRYNPEEMLAASISACHMLWYLHLCADAGIIVAGYTDKPTGTMIEKDDGSGYFKEVTLNPTIVLADDSKIEIAQKLHDEANMKCFIANSCNFEISHKPKFIIKKYTEELNATKL